jgi:hypothetical protein
MLPFQGETPITAIREWESLMRQIGVLAEQALDLAQGRTERLFTVNQLDLLIEATEHGGIVAESTYTREGAKAARAFIVWFLEGSKTELLIDTMPDGSELKLTPLQIMSAR